MIQNQQMKPAWKSDDTDEKKKDDGGMMSGLMSMSDKNSKEHIQRLSAKNDALMAALDQANEAAPQGSNMPATEYPKLPSHTNFAPADRVSAQNVGLQHAISGGQTSPTQQAQMRQMVDSPPSQAAPAPQAPPQGMQANPQQQNFARSQNPAFNVNTGAPDMSALDEAFRRQSMGG